ncbi:hypothetical protein [Streptomyces sp. NPDC005828]|uniref:hypothetical protein n=1 Tax=Streptomyces sp. NPDC005828 TaxID=3157071 RepID=UPI0033F39169
MPSGTICCTRRANVAWADCRFAFWNCLTLTEVGTDAEQVDSLPTGSPESSMNTPGRPGNEAA